MITSPEKDSDDDFFSIPLTSEETNNKRTAVRYIREDITATLSVFGLFNFSKYLPAKLLDISSKGVAIEFDKAVALKKKIILNLFFEDKKKFAIPAEIIHKKGSGKNTYGIKFERFNHELGDYLLSSQSILVFK